MATVTSYWDAARVTFDDAMDPESATVPCLVAGAADESAVNDALKLALSATFLDLSLDGAEILDRLSETEWKVEAKYAKPDDSSDLDPQYDFDTTGATAHITQNLSTVAIYGDDIPTDEKGAICVDDTRVNGTDIISTQFVWGETHYKYWVPASGEWTYKKTLRDLTGKVNDASFRGFAAGEVLFLGARGQRTGGLYNYWKIDYRFASSENQTGITVGSFTGIAKQGWHFLDVRYKKATSSVASIQLAVPQYVIIHQVYRTGDFSTLDIGTGTS